MSQAGQLWLGDALLGGEAGQVMSSDRGAGVGLLRQYVHP